VQRDGLKSSACVGSICFAEHHWTFIYGDMFYRVTATTDLGGVAPC